VRGRPKPHAFQAWLIKTVKGSSILTQEVKKRNIPDKQRSIQGRKTQKRHGSHYFH
jgi:hypothetical protein